jgi:hypothetical protein
MGLTSSCNIKYIFHAVVLTIAIYIYRQIQRMFVVLETCFVWKPTSSFVFQTSLRGKEYVSIKEVLFDGRYKHRLKLRVVILECFL